MGGIHSLQFTFWGVAVFPLFFFMIMAYKYWHKISMDHEILVVMFIHAINNGTAMFLAATLENYEHQTKRLQLAVFVLQTF